MIYFRQGLKGATMTVAKTDDPIEWLKSSVQVMRPNENPEKFKQDRAWYFLSGKMADQNGLVTRNDKNMIERDLLVLDIDDGQDHETVAERLAIAGYEALIYPTPRYHPNAERFRVVLRAERPITTPESYTATMAKVAEVLGGQFDPSSKTWSQMQGTPISKDGAFDVIHLEGEPFPVTDKLPESTTTALERRVEAVRDRTPIPSDEALEIMARYVERDAEKLIIRDNYLSALMAVIYAVQTGEIDYETGEQCAVMLAGDREDWKAGNLEQFRYEVRKTRPRKEQSFSEKFDWKPDIPTAEELFDAIEKPAKQRQRTYFTAEQLENAELPEITFYVYGMLPEGAGWLAGKPKVGKSYLLIQASVSIASGQPFLGHEVQQTPVIYYSLEMGPNLIQQRLRQMYPFTSQPKDLHFYFELPTFDNGALNVIHADIKRHGAGVVIVDTHGLIVKSKSSQKPLYDQSYGEMAYFKKLADETGTAIILVTHLNKNNKSDDIFDLMMGSAANRGGADFNMAMAKNPQDKEQILFLEECRKCAGLELVLERDRNGLFQNIGTFEDCDVRQEKNNYINDPVVETVSRMLLDRTKIEVTAKEIFEAMPTWAQSNKKPQSVGYALKKLAYNLRRFDGITFERRRRENGITYTFERPHNKITFLALKNKLAETKCSLGDTNCSDPRESA